MADNVQLLKIRESIACGIYKITSPDGSVYIGKSYNIRRRIAAHRRLSKNSNKNLMLSFSTYGVSLHKFEIIEEASRDCSLEKLNLLEKYYISEYKSSGAKVMNIINGGGGSRSPSEKTRMMMSLSAKRRGRNTPIGFRHSLELRSIFSAERKGCVSPNKGKVASIETRKKQSLAKIGRTGIDCCNSKKVICMESGVIFDSIGDAAFAKGIKRTTLNGRLCGQLKNRTSLKYI